MGTMESVRNMARAAHRDVCTAWEAYVKYMTDPMVRECALELYKECLAQMRLYVTALT